MPTQPTVCMNNNSGFYESGNPFSQSKWRSIIEVYYCLLEKDGKCAVRTLAKEACISRSSAHKLIKLHKAGVTSVPVSKKGHG